MFGPGNFLAGGFMTAMDADKDGALTRKEFQDAFDRWFTEWDTTKGGALDIESIRGGLNRTLMGDGRPGGPDGAGGGPGGPGFGLQGQAGGRNGMSAASGIHFEYVEARLNFAGTELPKVAVRYKGNGTYMDSRMSDKKSLKVDLNEFTKKQKVGDVTKLNFHNNTTDGGWMNEPLAHQLYRDAGVPAPRSSYARVRIDVPGTWTNHYLGLYSIVENPDQNWAEDRFGTKKGLILKPVTRELFKYQGDDWEAYRQAYDPKTEVTDAQKRRFLELARLVTNGGEADFAAKIGDYIDLDEFARFLAVTVWLSNTDSILMVGQNYVVHLHPETQRFQFVPWDLDRAFGNFFNPSPEEMSITQAWAPDNRFLERIMKVDAFRKLYLAKMGEFQKTIFRPERLAAQVDALAKALRPAVAEEGADKAERFDRIVAGQRPAIDGPGFGGPGGRGGFRMPSAPPIKAFAKARHQSVGDQLAGRSEGVPLSGGFGGPGGGRRGPGGGPGRPGGPGGPGDMGPGNFIAPVFLKSADTNRDAKVQKTEFEALAEGWFRRFDRKGAGKLSQDDLVQGLNAVIPPPDFGPPGG
jgi:spore coat protein H